MQSAAQMHHYWHELLELGQSAGLDAMGAARAEVFPGVQQTLQIRKQRGLSGGMQFTYRNPARSTNPRATLPPAATLVVGALSYRGESDGNEPATQPAGLKCHGQIASYAQRDYYGQLRQALETIAQRLAADGWQTRITIDDNALMDREAAFRAGLGWYGKNTCLLIPRRGSQFVLGSVLTDAPLPAAEPLERTCGSCELCQQACPTGALEVAGQLDARRCLAWLLQQAGVFPRHHRAALGGRFYGCDSCQTACPVGQAGQPASQLASRQASNELVAAGPAKPELSAPQVDILQLLNSTDAELLELYGSFYIAKREPRYLRRNALLVLGNVCNPDSTAVRETLRRALRSGDPIVRLHAVWAARRMGLEAWADPARYDHDSRVREETRLAVAVREDLASHLN